MRSIAGTHIITFAQVVLKSGTALTNAQCIVLISSLSLLQENIHRNFGMPQPNGYRKALRFMRHADKFGLPIVTFVDTPGAFAGKSAEESGQASHLQKSFCNVEYGTCSSCTSKAVGKLMASRSILAIHLWHCLCSAAFHCDMWASPSLSIYPGLRRALCFLCGLPLIDHISGELLCSQGEAIAVNLREMFGFRVPILSVVIGEGGSGGALAIGCANCNLIMEHSVYYVASPEACAAILWKARDKAATVSFHAWLPVHPYICFNGQVMHPGVSVHQCCCTVTCPNDNNLQVFLHVRKFAWL